MAKMLLFTWPGVTSEQYQQVREKVNWEGDTPTGAHLHVSGFDAEGMHITDVWDSEADFDNFMTSRLGPVIAEIGLEGEPSVQWVDAYAIFAPDPTV